MASLSTPEDVDALKVAELKAELKQRGLSTTGVKKVLADRLCQALFHPEAPPAPDDDASGPAADDAAVAEREREEADRADASAPEAAAPPAPAFEDEHEALILSAREESLALGMELEREGGGEGEAEAERARRSADAQPEERAKRPRDQDQDRRSEKRPREVVEPAGREPGPPREHVRRVSRGEGQGGRREATPHTTIHVQHLVRPYTAQALRDLLQQFGDVEDGSFWTDRIKSQCLVTYRALEDAQRAQEALDGMRWPEQVGRVLACRMVTEVEAEAARAHVSAPREAVSVAMPPSIRRDAVAAAEAERRPERPGPRAPPPPPPPTERADRSAEHGADRRRSSHDAPAEAARKPRGPTLDELFRKTETQPALFWLPLTEAEAEERARSRAAARSVPSPLS